MWRLALAAVILAFAPFVRAQQPSPNLPELPDLQLDGSSLTAESVAQIAGAAWRRVTLAGEELPTGTVESLAAAARIESLTLRGKFASRGLSELRDIPGLTALDIPPELLPAAPESLRLLPQLTQLTLAADSQLSVAQAQLLGRLTNLTSLSLHSVTLDDEALAELRPLVHLTELDLSDLRPNAGNITAAGLRALAHMRELRKLNLIRGARFRPPVLTDACLDALTQLAALEDLSLSGRITDASFARLLASLPQLTRLDISQTSVTPRGLVALRDSKVETIVLSAAQHLGGIDRWEEPLVADAEILAALPGLEPLLACESLKHVLLLYPSDGRMPHFGWSSLARRRRPDLSLGGRG